MLQEINVLDIFFSLIAGILAIVYGVTDRKFRALNLLPILAGITLSLVNLGRIFLSGSLRTHAISLVTVLITIIPLYLLFRFTNMVGLGDVLVVMILGFISPYPPLLPNFPALTPLSLVLASAYLIVRVHMDSRQYKLLIASLGYSSNKYKNVIVRRGIELRRELEELGYVTTYPVFIEGYGNVNSEVFSEDPQEITKRLIRDKIITDEKLVVAIPNYPLLYYYGIAFNILLIILSLIGGILA